MADKLENSIFFPGGRTIFAETNETDAKGLKITKKGDDWFLSINLKITAEEAKKVIRKFKDFDPLLAGETLDAKYPNQVYFGAFNDAGDSIDIGCKNVQLNIFFDHKTEEGGEIDLRFTPENGIGKTDNSKTKTDNAATRTNG